MVFQHPTIPAQAAFRAIDRGGRGLTTVVWEHALIPDIDLDALARAVAAVGRRHEALRTTVERAKDVCPAALDFMWLGFRNVVEENAHVTIEQLIKPGRPPRADPSRLPVFRFQVVADDTGPTLRVITDHALCDGWSLRVLCRDIELAYEYEFASPGRPLTNAYPFSQFTEQRYKHWRAGKFENAIRATQDRICDARPPVMDEVAGLSRWPFTQAYELEFSKQSTSRFENIRTRAGCTRFAVALSLFLAALNEVFSWRDLVVLVPNINRSKETLASVGLFSDSHFVVYRAAYDFHHAIRTIAASLADSTQGSPPAELVRERPAVREVLDAFPRVTGDVSFDVLPETRSDRRGPGIFLSGSIDVEATEEDVIRPVTTPKLPAQPDLRLKCSFSEQHHLSIIYRVDRIASCAAASVAQGILENIRKAA